jgi:cytochrome b pre-mRNA-processing protein 3
MIFHLFRRNPEEDSIASLYGMIVAQARTPAFYQEYGVPDTVQGRFEMIVLHLVLLLRRLAEIPDRKLGQAVFDLFCSDMDANLREMGIGDLAVPRSMQGIGEAFYGRQAAYGGALRGEPPALTAALRRNVFAGGDGDWARLASYVTRAQAVLASQPMSALKEVRFPKPEDVPCEGRS